MNIAEIIEHFRLEPLPIEGGLFRQTWRADDSPRPAGTAIVAMLTDEPDSFSALHRLAATEIWHRYLGDPVLLLLLHTDGSSELVVLGGDLDGGHRVQMIVPAGCWMGARLAAGGSYGLFGCTMAPGYHDDSFELGDRHELISRYGDRADLIESLTRE